MRRSIKFLIPAFIVMLCVVAWVYAAGIVGTASLTVASPTPTPAAGLQTAMNQLANDLLGGGRTTAIPTMCAAPGTPACTQQGSVSTSNLNGNGTTDNAANLNADLTNGDVSLPSGTYLIGSGVTLSGSRTLHCQNGASLTASSSQTITLSGGLNVVTNCVLTNIQIVINGNQYNSVVGNTMTGPSGGTAISLTNSTLGNVVNFNQISGVTTPIALTSQTHTQARINNLNGSMYADTPNTQKDLPMLSSIPSGLTIPNDFWAVLKVLETVIGNAGFTVQAQTNTASTIGTALNTGPGVLLQPGTYTISTSDAINFGTGNTMICEPGTKLFLTFQGGGHTRLLAGGYNSPTDNGNNMLLGCEIAGPDIYDPVSGSGCNTNTNPCTGNNANFNSYNELLDIQVGVGTPTDMLIAGNDFHDGDGDTIRTYAPNNSSQPNDVSLMFDNIHHSPAQYGFHQNGGANVHVLFLHNTNGQMADEMDSQNGASGCQNETGQWQHMLETNTSNSQNVGAGAGCNSLYWTCFAQSGCSGLGVNVPNCFMRNGVLDGTNLACAPGVLGINGPNGVDGDYADMTTKNGAVISSNLYIGPCTPCLGMHIP